MNIKKSLAVVVAAFTGGILCVSAQAQTYLTNGLVAYYPFNGNANDESGNGNNGTVAGATLTKDRFGDEGKAMAFNGLNQYIQAPHQDYLSFPSDEFTISCWVNLNDPTTEPQYLIGKDMGQGTQSKWIVVYGPVFHVNNPAIGQGWYTASAWTPDRATWHQLLFRKSGTHYAQFVDGRAESSEEGMLTLPRGNTAPLTIGQSDNGGGWVDGKIDDVRIYNRALSDQEVKDLYRYERPERPWVTMEVKTVQVTLHVTPTKNYQVQASVDLTTWTNVGAVFTAATSEVVQEFNATEVGRYFRVQEAP